MCELNTGYARTFNANHGRVNHLFGKRYWNRRITTDASLWNVVRYIVQNPRRAGGKGSLEGFRWTSYAATIGLGLADIQARAQRGAPVLQPRSIPSRRRVPNVLFSHSLGGTRPVAATVT